MKMIYDIQLPGMLVSLFCYDNGECEGYYVLTEPEDDEILNRVKHFVADRFMHSVMDVYYVDPDGIYHGRERVSEWIGLQK